MLNQIKRCYNYLDLPYNASIEDVQTRQKVMIKLIRAKGLKTGKLNEKKIKKINIAAEKIIFYINKYGPAKNGFFCAFCNLFVCNFIIDLTYQCPCIDLSRLNYNLKVENMLLHLLDFYLCTPSIDIANSR